MGVSILKPSGTGVGPCDINWHLTTGPCPARLMIETYFSGAVSEGAPLAVNFNGRGWAYTPYSPYGLSLCGSDIYVEFLTTGFYPAVGTFSHVAIDVWKAHIAGVWSSSVTIGVRRAGADISKSARVYRERFAAVPTDDPLIVAKTISYDSVGVLGCASFTTTRATVTVNDNGTFSIA